MESWQKSDYGAYAHAIEDVTCLEYHVPTVEQQVHELVVYMQGDYEIPLPELKYPKEDCYDCHEHGTFDQIVEMTAELEETVGANPHASHDRELECRPCHKMHAESEDHCRACHQWEWEVP
ncbi:MAG TPA: cytochrome c3 family protein [Anaerolineae bacterium]|nr:cytochrome c3 family protein [Anaerolineae bacterium]